MSKKKERAWWVRWLARRVSAFGSVLFTFGLVCLLAVVITNDLSWDIKVRFVLYAVVIFSQALFIGQRGGMQDGKLLLFGVLEQMNKMAREAMQGSGKEVERPCYSIAEHGPD